MTKRALYGVLAILLLVPPGVWYGARERLLPERMTTGVVGTLCWALSLACINASAWLIAMASSNRGGRRRGTGGNDPASRP